MKKWNNRGRDWYRVCFSFRNTLKICKQKPKKFLWALIWKLVFDVKFFSRNPKARIGYFRQWKNSRLLFFSATNVTQCVFYSHIPRIYKIILWRRFKRQHAKWYSMSIWIIRQKSRHLKKVEYCNFAWNWIDL